MKKILFLIIVGLSFIANRSLGQAAWIDPDPANVASEIKLMVNVADPACECPSLIDADSEGDSLYIWTWVPNGPPGGNGEWNASNLNLKMTSEGNNIWSFTMVPTDFYGVEPSVIYDGGIDFLTKKYDGSAVDGVEPKSVDFHVETEAPGCLNTLCSFPQVFQEDDYMTILYNNTKELNPGLQNIPEDDCYMYPVAVAGGVDYPYINGGATGSEILDFPILHMMYEGDGIFYQTILTDDFFRIYSENPVPDDVSIERIEIRFRRSVFTGNISTAYELELKCD